MSRILIELVDSDQGFDELRTEWMDLHARSPAATLSNAWTWTRVWWDIYKKPNWRLTIVVFRVGRELAGIAPLYRKRRLLWTELCFLGTGEAEKDEVASEYPDFLTSPAYASELAAGMWTALESLSTWSVLRIPNALGDSMAANLEAPSQQRTDAGFRYRITLPASWQEYLADRGSNMRRTIRQSEQDMADPKVRLACSREPGNETDDLFEHLVKLHQERWASVGVRGAFSSRKFSRFHKRLLQQSDVDVACELRVLFVDEMPVAALYNFRSGETDFFYQSGIAANERIRNPGVLIHNVAIEQAIADGQQYYDLMRGDNRSYKNRFRCEVTEMYNIVHFRADVGAWIAHFLTVAKLRLKTLLMSKHES